MFFFFFERKTTKYMLYFFIAYLNFLFVKKKIQVILDLTQPCQSMITVTVISFATHLNSNSYPIWHIFKEVESELTLSEPTQKFASNNTPPKFDISKRFLFKSQKNICILTRTEIKSKEESKRNINIMGQEPINNHENHNKTSFLCTFGWPI